MTKNKLRRLIEILRTDNGAEYTRNELGKYLSDHGIHRQLTVPHSPFQYGVAES